MLEKSECHANEDKKKQSRWRRPLETPQHQTWPGLGDKGRHPLRVLLLYDAEQLQWEGPMWDHPVCTDRYERQCDRADRGITPLHRPRDYNKEERRKKKLLAKSTWYWPKDDVGFFPGTPGGELAKSILEIVTEETERQGLTAKIVETGGMSLRNLLVRSDLTGCLIPSPLCLYCESLAGGVSHTRGGVVYMGQCLACRDNNITATYHGQSEFSAAKRGEEHKSGIDKADLSNSFAKHLHVHHPERERDSSTFEFKVVRNFKNPLNRQVFEGVRINQSDTLMNSKSEFHQPAGTIVTTVREVRSSGT